MPRCTSFAARPGAARVARALAAAVGVASFGTQPGAAGGARPVGAQPGGLAPPRVERDVPYRAGAGPDERLDLYVPAAAAPASRLPVVLFVHGGSLVQSGERRTSPMYAAVCPGLAAREIVCATMDYRLAPGAQWPAMPRDVAAAVRWLRDSVASRGGDPARITVVGHSSGCLLAALVALDSLYLGEVGLRPMDLAGVVAAGCTLAPWDTVGRAIAPVRLEAAFAADAEERRVYPSIGWRLRANPTRFARDSAAVAEVAPILVLVAESERFAPPVLEEGARFVRLLREAGRAADLRVLVGRRHVTTTTGFADPADAVADLVAAFARHPAGTVRTP